LLKWNQTPFLKVRVIGILCYGVKKVMIILIHLARNKVTDMQDSIFLSIEYVQVLCEVQPDL
jgi:hypothetical protein